MKKKMLAGVLAVLLGLAEASFPAAAQSTVSEENISSAEIREAYSAEKPVNAEMQTEDPKKAILAQDAAMEQQEDLEDEENMPAREPDPLVLDDDGSVVPASVAAWTDEDAEPETETEPAEKTGIQDPGESAAQEPEEEIFFDGNTDGTVEEAGASENEVSAADETADENEQADPLEEIQETADSETAGTSGEELEQEPEQAGVQEDTQSSTDAEAAGISGEELIREADPANISDASSDDTSSQEAFTSGEGGNEEFSDGDTGEGEVDGYRVRTLKIKNGQDITAPLNTLFLKLKDKATSVSPYKIIIPPGEYVLTGTLCMYSNMYLYAQGATITKTSDTKHLILRLGNTKESKGGYSGYSNIVIDGGKWDFNYKCVKGKDEPGGFVGFCIGHANNVVIKNATFLNNLKSHFLEFGGVKNATVTGCTFRGYYKNYVKGGQECIQIDCCTDEDNVFPQYMPYDGSTCEDFLIEGNTFENVFAGVGTHSMMTGKTYRRIFVRNNTFRNIRKRCVEFLNYENSAAENNTMINVGLGVEVSAVNKKNTHLIRGYKGGPDVNAGRKIRVTGNTISLANTTNIGGTAWICSGIKVYGYSMKETGGVIPKGIYPVKGVTVKNNQVSGYGNGISMKLTNTVNASGNQIKMKRTSAFSNLGIYADDSRGTCVKQNTVSGTANAGIYFGDNVYGVNSKQKNYISGNSVVSVGGDGIFLQATGAASRVEKNSVRSSGCSGIRVDYGKVVGIYRNTSSFNRNQGIRIEHTKGKIWIRDNQVLSNKKNGILIWKAKISELNRNTLNKNSGNGIYLNESQVQDIRSNAISGNVKSQAIYASGCKGWASIGRPVCKTVTSKSTAIKGTASGNRSVTAYVQKAGKLTKLGTAYVNKKKQFTIKIKKQKKNTAMKLISKDKYGNTVTIGCTVK